MNPIRVADVEFDSSHGDERLAALSRDLSETALDVTAILATATSSLSRIRQGTWVAVIMNPDPGTSRVVAADVGAPAMADYVDRYMAALFEPDRTPTAGLAQQVIESGSPILNPGVPVSEFIKMLSIEGQAFIRANPPPMGVESIGALMVPMRVGSATIGSLGMLDWRHDPLLVEADVVWVQAVADRVALSVEHARLVATTHDRLERMDLIRAIALANRYGQDLRLTLRVMVEQVTARLAIDAADVLLLTEPGGELVVAASAGFRSPSLPDYRLSVEADMPAQATSRPHVDHLSDLERAGRNPRRSLFAREGFRTVLRVPLHARNKLLGVLELYNRSLVDWDQDWLDFFEMLGDLAGVAIDYAVLTTPPDAGRRAPGAPQPELNELETEMLRLIVEGLTNRDISEQLHRSPNTIKFHVRRILEKTGTANRTELARRATREGWL
jgi:DNA-binding CsgD family transcriptional regulator